MRYTSEDFDDGMTDKDMYNGIRKKMTDSGRYYLLLDEVQEITGWEKAVNSLLENIVYIELRRKGYDVYIGKNETKEIDFAAIRRDERIYVQVCRNLPEESDREVANLLAIKDNYPKYVVTLDEYAAGNINGVKIVHLADFLLKGDY